MTNRKQIAFAMILTLSLTACSARQGTLLTAAVKQTNQETTDKRSVQDAIKPACGQPTRWNNQQKFIVGTYIKREADEPGMQLLAPEWDRLNRQVKTCRGE